ncbi:MAG: NAD(P)H-dependent oxidoreductase [Gammaproteobacteria bacterium]|nr:NAD(P)H-dependent oxidoreductase [Gammaproteobacteria bacterium]
MKILLLIAHPYLHRSKMNAALLASAAKLPEVEIFDLYETYPDFYIDATAERNRLMRTDLLIMQFPFYWYSAPALLKEWQDRVITPTRHSPDVPHPLAGKPLMLTITTGQRLESYLPQVGDSQRLHTMSQLLSPLKQLAHHCGMPLLQPFTVHGCRHLTLTDLQTHAKRYQNYLQSLIDQYTIPADGQ